MNSILDTVQYQRINILSQNSEKTVWIINKNIRPNVAFKILDESNGKFNKKHLIRFLMNRTKDVDFNPTPFYKFVCNINNIDLIDVQNIAYTCPNDLVITNIDKYLINYHLNRLHGAIFEFLNIFFGRYDISMSSKMNIYRIYYPVILGRYQITDFMSYHYTISRCASQQDIEDYPDFPWNYVALAESPFISIDFFKTIYCKYGINSRLSQNHHIVDAQVVLNNPELKWDPYNLFCNNNISYDDILMFRTLNGYNTKIPVSFLINKYIEKYGCVDGEKITEFFNKEFQDVQIDHLMANYLHIDYWCNKPQPNRFMLNNISLTFDKINNIKPDYYHILNINPYVLKIKEDDADVIEFIFKNICAKRIQKLWRICISSPEYLVCKSRLTKEFNTLIRI